MAGQYESRPGGNQWVGINTSDNPLMVRNNTLLKALDVAISSKGVITSRGGWLTYRQGRTSPLISDKIISYQVNSFPVLDANALPNDPLDSYSRFIQKPVSQYSWDEMPRSETPSFVERPMAILQDLYGYNYIASCNREGVIDNGAPFAKVFAPGGYIIGSMGVEVVYHPNYFGQEKISGEFGSYASTTNSVGYRLPAFGVAKSIQGYYNTARGLGDLQRVYGKTISNSDGSYTDSGKHYQVASTPASVTSPMALDVTLSNANEVTEIQARNRYYCMAAYRAITNQGEKGTYINSTVVNGDTYYTDIQYNERLSAPTARACVQTDLIPNVSSISWASNVATITTESAHGLSVGNKISILQSGVSGFNGDFDVVSVVSPTVFTISTTIDVSSAVVADWGIYKQATVTLYRPKEQFFDVEGDPRGMSLFYDYTHGQWELYRTKILVVAEAVGPTDPGDEMYLCSVDENASLEGVTSNKITFLDKVLDANLGRFLYTNPSQEGIQGANSVAPAAVCIEYYQGHMFFGGTTQQSNVLVTFTAVPDSVIGGTITVSANQSSSFILGIGEVPSAGVVGVPNATLDKNKRIEEFAKSFVRCVNETATLAVKAEYVSGMADTPGQVMLRALDYDYETVVSFASDISGLTFTSVSNDNTQKTNRIYYSKLQQPYAVPGFNYFDVPHSANILNMVALSNRLMIMTDAGTYEITGYDTDSFVLKPYDLTLTCVAPKTCQVFEDTLFMLSNKGVVVCGNSANNISLAWDKTWKQYINLNSIDSSHAIVDPVNRDYLLFMASEVAVQHPVDLMTTSGVVSTSYAERVAKRCFVYNATANSWVEHTFDLDAGHYTRLFPNFAGNVSDTGGIMAWRYIDYYGLETVARAQSGEPYYNVDGVRTLLTTSNAVEQPDGTFKQDVVSAWIVSDTQYVLYTSEVNEGDYIINPFFYEDAIRPTDTYIKAKVLKVERQVEPVTKSVYYTVYTDVALPKVFDIPSNTVYNGYSTSEISANRYEVRLSNTTTLPRCQHMRTIPHSMTFHPFNAGSTVTRKNWTEIQLTFRGNNVSQVSVITKTDDVKREIETTWTNSEVNDGFGSGGWGELPWGNPVIPEDYTTVRLYVPAEHQTGRNLSVTLKHDAMDESFELVEIAVLYDVTSTNTVV